MAMIFESPDGGETVYVREYGETTRVLYSESNKKKSLHSQLMESKLWGDIHRAAEHIPALQDALERVKVIYYLTDDYEERYGNRRKT
jgi:hypothetical protein